eukprot:4270043-Pleurochrysis_carterae.AAC.1
MRLVQESASRSCGQRFGCASDLPAASLRQAAQKETADLRAAVMLRERQLAAMVAALDVKQATQRRLPLGRCALRARGVCSCVGSFCSSGADGKGRRSHPASLFSARHVGVHVPPRPVSLLLHCSVACLLIALGAYVSIARPAEKEQRRALELDDLDAARAALALRSKQLLSLVRDLFALAEEEKTPGSVAHSARSRLFRNSATIYESLLATGMIVGDGPFSTEKMPLHRSESTPLLHSS